MLQTNDFCVLTLPKTRLNLLDQFEITKHITVPGGQYVSSIIKGVYIIA
jgi:hypothetical protein